MVTLSLARPKVI
ncbi:rCG31016 [Rattus norvegicus]|uniref:RCG31016 n=1 Tax=Rattus norvegicus TaxID=10116 RepID=A6IS99_RAT|nr:rCG31016 [Rattus norvegicus]